MSKPNDGGLAFPVASVGTGDPRDGMTRGSDGMSLRVWLASTERLSDWDHPEAVMSKEISEALAGEPTPAGGWSASPRDMIRFEAKWRAALKAIRADALIAEFEKEVKP